MYPPQIKCVPLGVTSYRGSLVYGPERNQPARRGGKWELGINQKHTHTTCTHTHPCKHRHTLSFCLVADLLILMKVTRPLWPSRLPSLLVSFQQAITGGIVEPFHLSDIHKHTEAHTHTKQWRVIHYTSLVILNIFTFKLLQQIYSIDCSFLKQKHIEMDVSARAGKTFLYVLVS